MNENPSPDSLLQEILHITNLEERAAYLERACGEDEALREQIESLLAAQFAAEAFLDPAVTAELEEPGEQVGDMIGHYKLLQRIGEGGFGRVWMAEQREPIRRQVALKLIKPGMDSKEVIARFEAERQALALMDHPNIAHVHEAGASKNGRPYFVMELVKGIPLTNYCADRQIGTKERLGLFLDVCSAVRHAHQKGVIHRDLKPSNILISPHDGEPVVKVIDFGIAKAIGMELTDKTVFTALGRMIGTPQYMSPEQAELNALDVDTRSDIYSLGVVLYELLTGKTPLDGEKLRSAAYEEMQRMIREEEPDKPSTRISELREQSKELTKERESELRALQSATARELDWIVLKALEKERRRRYQTVDSFADDLRRYLAGEVIEARPPSVLYRWKKIARRHRGGIAAAAAIILTLIASAATSTYLAVIASRDRDAAQREAAISQTVNEFINNDLFGSADPDQEPDRDLKVRAVLDRASASIEGRFKDQPLVEASIRMTLGRTYYGLGEYLEAEVHADRSYQLRKRELGETHEDTLESLNGVATARAAQGDHAQAIQLFQKILEVRRAKLGPEHIDTLRSMTSLAGAYLLAGRTSEALDLSEKTLELRRKVLGPEHPDTLGSMNNLAGAYLLAGRTSEALELWEAILELQRKLCGPEHPDTLGSMNNLAAAYLKAGRASEAVDLCEETLELQRKVLGPEHPATLTSMGNLAGAYHETGLTSEAVELWEETLELLRKILGPEHPDTLTSMGNLAGAYRLAGRTSEALDISEKTLELRRKVLGPEHPDTLKSMGNLGSAYSDAGRTSEALELREETLELRRKILPPKHPDTLKSMSSLASSYHDVGRRDEALEMREEVLDLRRKILGPEHRDTLTSMYNLASSYHDAGRRDKALKILEKLLEMSRRVCGPEHPDTLASMAGLAYSYREAGRTSEAVELDERTLELRRKVLGPEHPDTLESMGNLAAAYDSVGRTPEALELREETLKLRRKVLGPEHPDTLKSMGSLTGAYLSAGRTSEGMDLGEKALELRRKALGPEHPHTLEFMGNLTGSYLAAGRTSEALELSEKTLELRRKVLGPEHPDTLGSMTALALSYKAAGRTSEALELGEETLELCLKILGREDPATLGSMTNLAGFYAGSGRIDEAVALEEEALAIKRRVLPPDHRYLASAILTMGVLYSAKDRTEEALALFQELLVLRRKEFGPAHPDTVTALGLLVGSYRKAGRVQDWARTISEHAEFLRRAGNGPDGELQAVFQKQLTKMAEEQTKGPVEEGAMDRHYAGNKESFRETSVRLYTITFELEATEEACAEQLKKAEALRVQIVGGTPFAEVAHEHSKDNWTAGGGDRGKVERGDYKEPLNSAIFALQPGTLSIHDDGTFLRILKVEDRVEGEIPPLKDVRADIMQILQQQKRDELLQQWREEARLKVEAWEKENKGTGGPGEAAGEKGIPKTQRER